jgi:hypothetical protein
MTMSDDEITAALMLGTEMTPEKVELVPPCPWLEALQRKTGLPTLFVYRHRKTGKFGLAQWTVKPKTFGQGIAAATEICLFSAPPGQNPPDLPDMEWLMWRCKPEGDMVDEMRRNRLNRISERQLALVERKNVLDEMEKVLRKRKLDEAADNLSLEDVPDDGPELDQMRELLRWAMNDKIISTG